MKGLRGEVEVEEILRGMITNRKDKGKLEEKTNKNKRRMV